MPERNIKPGQGRGSRRTPLIVTTFDPLAGPGRPTTDPRKMTMPFQCLGCGVVYDGARVEVTGRYADCSVWKAPCCGATHDDRVAWTGGPGRRMGYIDLSVRERAVADSWRNP